MTAICYTDIRYLAIPLLESATHCCPRLTTMVLSIERELFLHEMI